MGKNKEISRREIELLENRIKTLEDQVIRKTTPKTPNPYDVAGMHRWIKKQRQTHNRG